MIAILTGGTSSERNVSLATAQTITDSLDRLGMPYAVFDLQEQDWLTQLKRSESALALLAIHGTFGEDGGLQAILEEHSIPYTGSTSVISKLAFDKRLTKEVLAEIGIPMGRELDRESLSVDSLPFVVKPNRDGSSVGVSIVHDLTDLDKALSQAGSDPLIEEFISGREFSCAVTDIFGSTQALPLVEIKPTTAFFDYEAKYTEGMSVEICPAELEAEITENMLRLSERVFERLGIRQYARVDWILRDGIPYFLEINTIPGMTPTSLINKEIAAAGIRFDDFIAKLIETSTSSK